MNRLIAVLAALTVLVVPSIASATKPPHPGYHPVCTQVYDPPLSYWTCTWVRGHLGHHPHP